MLVTKTQVLKVYCIIAKNHLIFFEEKDKINMLHSTIAGLELLIILCMFFSVRLYCFILGHLNVSIIFD